MLIRPSPDTSPVLSWLPVRPARLIALGPLVGVVSGTLSYLIQVWRTPGITNYPYGQWAQVVFYNVVAWTSWIALIPVMAWLAWRVPIRGDRRMWPILFHTSAALGLAVLHVFFLATAQYVQFQVSGQHEWPNGRTVIWMDLLKQMFLFNLEWEFLLYWGIVGSVHAWVFHQQVQERALAETHLRARLAEAQLDALQRQLQPHFLLNTLNSITTLMHRDMDAAETMIERLGRFLYAVMRSDMRHVVALEEELALTLEYLDLQRVRLGSDLRAEVDVPRAARNAAVPSLLLQPLVENALEHGFGSRSRGGTIRLAARVEGDRLTLTVEDDGEGAPTKDLAELDEGVGLANTRARLEQLYGGAHTISFDRPADGGFRVTIVIPLRPMEARLAEHEPEAAIPA